MAYEDDWIRDQIKRLIAYEDVSYGTGEIGEILEALLKKINNLEQEVKELRNGGKKR